MSKSSKIISGLLGIIMLMFGTLKFINPVSGLYETMISKSGLPQFFLWPGHIGELGSGLLLLCTIIFYKKMDPFTSYKLRFIGSVAVVIIMLVAVYVHLHPNVPAEVLPLAKPPILPGVFLVLALVNIYLTRKSLPSVKTSQVTDFRKVR